MSSPSLFAVSKQESLLYGKKKGLYWVIICIGTKEVKNGKLTDNRGDAYKRLHLR